uniref:CAAX amino terminal protease n=1 Tax=Tanacetum cinerariifolium TaxID=118510 RepID=A0A699GVY8_TANCI|nr:CAAX amino terminal protease [Tanacetum cinerariifolium]
MALWMYQIEEHTSDWLKVVSISRLGQTMNSRTYRVFAGNIYGDHVVSCTGIVGIKHRHNIVRDTLVNICFRSEISAEIGYGFLLFSFSSFGELEGGAVTLLKWIRKFSVTQDIRARTAVYIFSRISFAIARKVAYTIVAMRRGWTNEEIMRSNVQAGIIVRKEAQMGLLAEDGKDLRPAGLLLFNWLQGKDACLDVTGIPPFAVMGVTS